MKLSEATRINERMLLDWQRSWSKAEGRLGDVEVTSSAGVLTVSGDQDCCASGGEWIHGEGAREGVELQGR